MKELPIIIKADVQGSAEVLADTLSKLTRRQGRRSRSSTRASAPSTSRTCCWPPRPNAIIIGFNVRPDRNAADVAERERVDIRHHSVIYNVDRRDEEGDGRAARADASRKSGSASPQVRDLFKVPKFGTIAGCMVIDGRITRCGDAQARLLRDNVVVQEGKIASLRRFKDDVSEVQGRLRVRHRASTRFNDIKVGDVIECFTIEKVAAVSA